MNDGRAVCSICGRMAASGTIVAPGMAALDEKLWTGKGDAGRVIYASLNRCADRVACRDRLEAGGSKWPVIEAEGIGRRTALDSSLLGWGAALAETDAPQPTSDVQPEDDPWAAFLPEKEDEWAAFG